MAGSSAGMNNTRGGYGSPPAYSPYGTGGVQGIQGMQGMQGVQYGGMGQGYNGVMGQGYNGIIGQVDPQQAYANMQPQMANENARQTFTNVQPEMIQHPNAAMTEEERMARLLEAAQRMKGYFGNGQYEDQVRGFLNTGRDQLQEFVDRNQVVSPGERAREMSQDFMNQQAIESIRNRLGVGTRSDILQAMQTDAARRQIQGFGQNVLQGRTLADLISGRSGLAGYGG